MLIKYSVWFDDNYARHKLGGQGRAQASLPKTPTTLDGIDVILRDGRLRDGVMAGYLALLTNSKYELVICHHQQKL